MNQERPAQEKKGICGICSAGCWIIAEYDDYGRIASVRPDKDSDMGMLCTIGKHSPDIIYSPDRLLYPMKRTGAKGAYDFERISWDEAYSTITEKLQAIKKEYGPEAAAIYTGVGTFELSLCDVFQPKGVAVSSASSVLFPFGSPNTMGVGALCYVSYGMIAPHVTCGEMLINMFNDMEHSELIVIWGTNPATDLPPVELQRVMEARTHGSSVIVIDPRKTMTAKMTDAEWIPIRPGTDGALALGLCNIIIREELYDEDFVSNWTVGFNDFAQYVQHFRPEVVEGITGIPSKILLSLARRLARAKGVSQLMYTGLEYGNSGVQSIRASLILWALAGQLDVPGGRCFRMKKNAFPINRDGLIQNPDRGVRIGRARFPVYVKYRDEIHPRSVPDSVLNGNPYHIRSLIIQGASITTSWPNPDLWKKTLGALDFLVCIDRQLTADAAYADILLPATTYYENTSYMVYGSLFKIRERMIEPLGEARSDFFIMAELAKRLGYGHLYPQDEDELLRYVLKGSGFTYEDVKNAGGMAAVETEMMQYKKWEKGLLRPDGQPGFNTPSGKFEIASSLLEEYGYDPLPVYIEPREGPLSRPDLLNNYPLVFNSGARVKSSFHTQHHGIQNLQKQRPEPAVTINTEDAVQRGISNGDVVRIKTLRGAITMRALVTEDIVKGAIDANHACGSPVGPEAWRKHNINYLTDKDQYDPISGFPVYKSLLCEIEKVESGGGALMPDSGEIRADEIVLNKTEKIRKEIYLDHNATTPLHDDVKETMARAMDSYGNPSSLHGAGKRSRAIVENARRALAEALNSTSRRIIFTGSGSEADNIALKGIAFAQKGRKNHIITSSIEHPAVLNACRWLEKFGFFVTYLSADRNGIVHPDELRAVITEETCLVSVMTANNETGSIQPIRELSDIAHEKKALFHTDAVQAFGKIPLDVEELGVDLLSVSAHKLYGPKGIGALYIRKNVHPDSLISGGGHEFGLRAGTENIIGIAGFGKTAELIPNFLADMKWIETLRDRLEKGIRKIVKDCKLNGHRTIRLPNTLNIVLPGFRGESVVLAMERRGVYFSSGSACSAGSSKPSHALLAMSLSEEEAHCSLRFSLGIGNDEEDIDMTIAHLEHTINHARNTVHFVPCR
jgi:cysteine desulfurase NifS